MDNPKFLEDLVSRVRQVFAESPAADVEKNLRAVLTSFFNRLDLVTREEFEVQEAVLQRTREKLARLEARVEKLEAAARGKDTGGSHD
jgi:BMFP domain-containing protein YqiC